MYGLPNSAPLSQVVQELTEAHHHSYGELSGIEPGLLILLRDAVATSSGRGSAPGGGGSKASAPVDAAALTLWDSIERTVDANWPGRYDRNSSDLLPYKLQQWVGAVAGTPNEVHLLEMTTWWRKQIRDLLDPPRIIAVRGAACPDCGARQVYDETLEGTTLSPALVAYASETPMRVVCQACLLEWVGELAIQMMSVGQKV